MSDATCRAYALVRGGTFANKVLAGVGKDRALYLLNLDASGVMTAFRGPLRPPRPEEGGTQKIQSASVDLNPLCRPVIWNVANDFFVAVAAGGKIWVWHENVADSKQSGWKFHSSVRDLPATPAAIEDIILKKSGDTPSAVLSNGRFWVYDGSEWSQPEKPKGVPLRDYAVIAPIYVTNGRLTDSVVAVSRVGQELYWLEFDGKESPIAPGLTLDRRAVPGGSNLPGGLIRPAAIDDGTSLRVVAVALGDDDDKLVALTYDLATGKSSDPQEVSLGTNVHAIGAEVTVAKVAGTTQFSIGAKRAADRVFVASWVPTFKAADPTAVFESTIPDASGDVGGTPLVVGSSIVVPGGRGDAFVAPLDQSLRLPPVTNRPIVEGVILPAPAPFKEKDFISVMFKHAGKRMEWKIEKEPARGVRGHRSVSRQPRVERLRRGRTGTDRLS